eukprot:2178443-Pyramimonas_sp.AAC.1
MLRWEPQMGTVAIVVPVGTAMLKVVATSTALLAAGIGVVGSCCCGTAKENEGKQEPTVQQAATQQTPTAHKPPKQPQRTFCDAGVMGPVHYNGVRYVHETQGFRRANE